MMNVNVVSFEDTLKAAQSNMDFDFFISFKDNKEINDIDCLCLGYTTFDVEMDMNTEVHYDGNGLVFNPFRCIQDPVELLMNLQPYIDLIFI